MAKGFREIHDRNLVPGVLSMKSDTKGTNLDHLGITEEDVKEFGKSFLKNVDNLAEIDDAEDSDSKRMVNK